VIYDAIKRLTKHSVIYALGPAVHRAIGFVLLPLVTAYIGTTANYGITEMAAVAIGIGSQLFGINLLYGMTRFYPEYETEEERARLVSTTLVLITGLTAVAVALALVFREQGAELLFGSRDAAPAFVAIAFILLLQSIGQVGLRYLQIRERSVAYGVVTTLKLLCEVGLKVWFLVGLGLLYMGVFYSVLAGEALVAAGAVYAVLRRSGLVFSVPMAKKLVRYSYPLILSGLCMFVLHQADRFVLRHFDVPLGDIGLYGFAYKLGAMASTVIIEAFGLIWFTYIFGIKDETHVVLLCRKVLTYFTLIMTVASLAIAVLSPELARTMGTPEYFESHRAMPIIALGYVFWAIFQVVHTVFYIRQKTGQVTVLVAFAAVFNVALNAVLAPSYGYMGAAWATLGTFVVLAAAAWVVGERVMPVGYELSRVAVPIALAVVLFFASRMLPPWPFVGLVAAKLALVAAHPILLWLAGYLNPSEKDKIKAMSKEALDLFTRRARRAV
jgi:O-antigen/teichoic acid export membrane protein